METQLGIHWSHNPFWGWVKPQKKNTNLGDERPSTPAIATMSPLHSTTFHLVGGLEHDFYDFPITLGMSSSQLTFISPSFFRGLGQLNHQPDQQAMKNSMIFPSNLVGLSLKNIVFPPTS